MKSEWQSYRRWAKRFVTEIRHPYWRLVIALVCLLLAGALGWRVTQLWLQFPTTQSQALAWLALPLLGSVFLLYVVYLLLFAPVARQRLGLLPAQVLIFLGVCIILAGVWGIMKGLWEALFLVGLGMACLSLAKERAQRKLDSKW